jgi:hypothetical protein
MFPGAPDKWLILNGISPRPARQAKGRPPPASVAGIRRNAVEI